MPPAWAFVCPERAKHNYKSHALRFAEVDWSLDLRLLDWRELPYEPMLSLQDIANSGIMCLVTNSYDALGWNGCAGLECALAGDRTICWFIASDAEWVDIPCQAAQPLDALKWNDVPCNVTSTEWVDISCQAAQPLDALKWNDVPCNITNAEWVDIPCQAAQPLDVFEWNDVPCLVMLQVRHWILSDVPCQVTEQSNGPLHRTWNGLMYLARWLSAALSANPQASEVHNTGENGVRGIQQLRSSSSSGVHITGGK
eukprot:1161037-Pelagomonas_calceolata.AAC.6